MTSTSATSWSRWATFRTFVGEVNAARDPRIVQLGIKLYF